jgi:hypothetical protein
LSRAKSFSSFLELPLHHIKLISELHRMFDGENKRDNNKGTNERAA